MELPLIEFGTRLQLGLGAARTIVKPSLPNLQSTCLAAPESTSKRTQKDTEYTSLVLTKTEEKT